MSEQSILDARLAEIDRRLRTIQSGLGEVPPAADVASDPAVPAEPAGPSPPASRPHLQAAPTPAAAPRRAAEPADRLAELADAHERLLELHRELLSQYAEVLERRAAEESVVAVSAGPFSRAEAVREFESALHGLPGVAGVQLREYLAGDRVLLDVRLAGR